MRRVAQFKNNNGVTVKVWTHSERELRAGASLGVYATATGADGKTHESGYFKSLDECRTTLLNWNPGARL